ncbi:MULTISPECIES: hypothetical protein [Halorussus]|uniref:hypothetical protein n=1 Tax=Halorussus TaxID=1070314 RepID=UPI00209FEC3C|nr:hypothetical protein [Halorussus vallis]USZ77452.1 hypothetical protein NGM07_08990 [Halorussus vallis]
MRRDGGERPLVRRAAPTSAVVFHGGVGFELTLLEYLSRVVFSLFAFGGVAVVVFWGTDVVRGVRSRVVEKLNRRENDP